MYIVNFDDIKNLNISNSECYSWVVDMITDKNKMILPPKISIKPFSGVFCNVMPSFVSYDGKQFGGVKVVTRYPDREPSLNSKLLLFDAKTGENLAFMDANWITAMRTGAVATHSISLFAVEGFSEIGMLGLGNTARATLLMLLDRFPDRHFNIKLFKYKEQEKIFIERFIEYENISFRCVESYEEVIRGSQVVISAATYLPYDVAEDDAYDEGVLVVPIHTLGFTNCDIFFDRIFADDIGHVSNFKNFDKFKNLAEVTDVVNEQCIARGNSKERILAYNIGVSTHDVYFAANIYERLWNEGSLINIEMHEPLSKFWI